MNKIEINFYAGQTIDGDKCISLNSAQKNGNRKILACTILDKYAPVQKIQTLNVSQLAELLNKEMTLYYALTCDRSFRKELVDCKERIKEIQKEIYNRKNTCPK